MNIFPGFNMISRMVMREGSYCGNGKAGKQGVVVVEGGCNPSVTESTNWVRSLACPRMSQKRSLYYPALLERPKSLISVESYTNA